MDSMMQVTVPTFVNAHLFWILKQEDLMLRCAMNKVMKTKLNYSSKIENLGIDEEKILAVHVDGIWARALVKDIIDRPESDPSYVCWLPDYGTIKTVDNLFSLPKELEKCPFLAKQASLHNVVNLMTDLVLGDYGYEFKLQPTLNDIQGVRKVALDCIEGADKVLFSIKEKDDFNIYGDVICLYDEDVRQSLTDYLIDKNLIEFNKEMFRSIERSREQFKRKYYKQSENWRQELDKSEVPEKHQPNKRVFTRREDNSLECLQH